MWLEDAAATLPARRIATVPIATVATASVPTDRFQLPLGLDTGALVRARSSSRIIFVGSPSHRLESL